MWDLPRPGLEPTSPALAHGFLTTAPPGKPRKAELCLDERVWVREEDSKLGEMPEQETIGQQSPTVGKHGSACLDLQFK